MTQVWLPPNRQCMHCYTRERQTSQQRIRGDVVRLCGQCWYQLRQLVLAFITPD